MSVANSKPIRVALAGYGLAGSVFHAPLITATPNMVLDAIIVRNEERKTLARKNFPSAKIFFDVQEFFSHIADYDLLVVATPNKTHFDICKAALQKKIAVVVDKPMCGTYRESLELIEISKQTGAPFSVFQNRRWDADFLTVKKLLAEGKLGNVLRFESRFERWRPTIRPDHWREAGAPDDLSGLLYDLGSHLIDQAVHLFGKPQYLYAERNVRRESGRVPDDVFLSLSFENGVRAHLWASALACKQGPRFQIFGSQGSYLKYGLDVQENALRAGESPSKPTWGKEAESAYGELTRDENGQISHSSVPSEAGDYGAFYRGMRDAIVLGTPVPVDPADAAQTIKIIEVASSGAAQTGVFGAVPF